MLTSTLVVFYKITLTMDQKYQWNLKRKLLNILIGLNLYVDLLGIMLGKIRNDINKGIDILFAIPYNIGIVNKLKEFKKWKIAILN